MKATAFEFRFRVVLMILILVMGFWSPWIEWLHWGTRTTAWLWLGFQLGALGVSSTTGIEAVTGLMIAVTAVAAAMRVWGTAYLGLNTVNNTEMKAGSAALDGAVLADGPFRFVRNPLYIGTWLLMGAISVLMPTSGSVVTLVLITVLLVRLILGEEAFLKGKLGMPYLAYSRAVPRLFPSLRTQVVSGGHRPDWGRALLGEVSPIGICLSFAVLSWQYNSQLLIQAVIVSFGVSIVVRALLARKPETAPA